ncbi:hypothetical protein ACFFSW_25615 [Saccharothrix longispora]|uniref:DDE family transposase n=1 Tax=Saccharothrix longispora TaxID=33920 RepID=A0ABU1PPB6_9PSEU|nr:hypothetical protein [Saccharothrix longispora]MDR6592508.1 hypothetical protein [Saccharothrix longispora]
MAEKYFDPMPGAFRKRRASRSWLSSCSFTARQGLRKIQYRSDLINGCLIGIGLQLHPT